MISMMRNDKLTQKLYVEFASKFDSKTIERSAGLTLTELTGLIVDN